jgi:hypothetical protein
MKNYYGYLTKVYKELHKPDENKKDCPKCKAKNSIQHIFCHYSMDYVKVCEECGEEY